MRSKPLLYFALAFFTGLLALVQNVAAGYLPQTLRENQSWVWPSFVVLTVLSATLGWLALDSGKVSNGEDASAQARDRSIMLGRVQWNWLREYNSKAVRPYDLSILKADGTTATMPRASTLKKVIDDASGVVILAGRQGSGKTTTLLGAAAAAVAMAIRDPNLPMPVILRCTFWRGQRFHDWLTSQLTEQYSVPTTVARRWIEAGNIDYYLDGIDDIPVQHREGFAHAVRDFTGERLTRITMTCNTASCRRLAEISRAQSLIFIEELTVQQALDYLKRRGIRTRELRRAINDVPALTQFIGRPLVLERLVELGNNAVASMSTEVDAVSREHTLLRAYIDSLIERAAIASHYSTDQIKYYLARTHNMLLNGGTRALYPWALSPKWLPKALQPWASRGFDALILSLSVVLGVSATYGIYHLMDALFPDLAERRTPFGALSAVVTGVGVAMGIGVVLHIYHMPVAEQLRWSLKSFRKKVGSRVPYSFAQAVVVGAVTSTVSGYSTPPVLKLVFGGSFAALAAAVALATAGLENHLSEVEISAADRLKRIKSRFIWSGFAFSLPYGIWAAVLYGIFFRPMVGLLTGLHTMLPIFVITALLTGGAAYLRSLTIRGILYGYGWIPRRYLRFLDFATDDVGILQRVGGGYQFRHDTLREYFGRPHNLDDTPVAQEH